ncbi:MAG TPA: biotin/lipoyl-binding protein [Actinoplanes sp.]
MRRLPSLLVNLVLTALALGAGGWSAILVRDPGTATASAAASGTRTVTVAQGLVTATVSADGTVATGTTASASFATSGTVTAVSVTVGQQVTKGQTLAKIDPAEAQRSLALAKANLKAATDSLDRAEDAGTDTTTAANAVTTARLEVTDAQAAVTGAVLTAPMAGTVVAVNGTLGSTASASASASSSSSAGSGGSTGSGGGSSTGSSGFVEIADLTDLQVTADFAETDATRLVAGQAATITWSALTGATATGKVLSVDPSGTSSNGVVTYGGTISIDKLPTGARPGQSVSVSVVTGTAANAVYVNSAAVTVAGNTYTVQVRKDDGTIETRGVKVGLAGDEAYQILSGLTLGEKVVVPQSTATATSTDDSRQQGPGSGTFGGTAPGGNGGPP